MRLCRRFGNDHFALVALIAAGQTERQLAEAKRTDHYKQQRLNIFLRDRLTVKITEDILLRPLVSTTLARGDKD